MADGNQDLQTRIAAGQELRRRGKLNDDQIAALQELERRSGMAEPAAPVVAPVDAPAAPAEVNRDDPDSLMAEAVRVGREGDIEQSRILTARAAGLLDIERPDNFGEALGGSTETLVRGIGQGSFGAGDYLATAGGLLGQAVRNAGSRIRGEEVDENSVLNAREMFAFQRARREAMSAIYRGSAVAGYGTGAVVSGGAAAKGVAAGARTVPGVGAPVAAALTTTKGQPIANVARTSVQGAAAGGVAGGLEEGSVEGAKRGAAIGAIAGPIGLGLFKAAGGVGSAIAKRIQPEKAGLDALAKIVRTPAAELRQRFDDFEAATGRKPSLAELLDREAAEEIAQIAGAQRGAGQVFREAEEAATAARPARVSREVTGGRVTTSPSAQSGRQARSMDATMEEIGDEVVPLAGDEVQLLASRDVLDKLPGPLRRRIVQAVSDAQEAAGESGEALVELNVRQIDNIRQALRKASGPGDAQRYRVLADEFRDIGSEAVPRYGQALREFGRRGDTISGVSEGRKVLSAGDTREFVDAAEGAESIGQIAGQRAGARTALEDAALESPASARRLVDRLANDDGLRTRIAAALDPGEASRIQRLGRAEARAAENLETIAPQRLRTKAQETAGNITEAARGIVLASGRGSGAFITDFFARQLIKLRVPPTAARKLAEMATDPDEMPAIIDRLTRRGLNSDQIEEVYRSTARAVAAGSGASAAEGSGQ